MSYPFYGYVPPGHTAQATFSPAYPTSMPPVQIQPFQVHPGQPLLVSEHWIIPGEPLLSPRHTSRRQRSERKAFEAYDYPPPQSKPNDHSRAYGQRRIRPEQSLHPRKAIEYQDQKQEADEYAYYSDDATAVFTGSESPSDILDGKCKETKKSRRSQDVHTKGGSSKMGHVQEWVESQPDTADKQVKGSSANPAGTERKHTKKSASADRVHTKGDSSKLGHTQKYIESQPDAANKQSKGSSADPAATEREHKTKQSTRATHAKSDSKRRPEKPAEQAKERASTSTAGTARVHTTGHSSSTKFFIRPGESHSGPKITINHQEGSSMKFKSDRKGWEFEITPPGEKSKGHRSKEKAKESSRGSRSTQPTKEELPDYYAIAGCSMYADTETISREVKKKQRELHPDKRVKSDMSEQRIAEINMESALINEAAEVLRDEEKRAQYDEEWNLAYGMDRGKKPVFR